VSFSQSISLHAVNLSSGMSGSYLSILNGTLSPGRRDSVGPWSALSVSSIRNDVTPMLADILFRQPISPSLCVDWNVGGSTFTLNFYLFDRGSLVSLDETQ